MKRSISAELLLLLLSNGHINYIIIIIMFNIIMTSDSYYVQIQLFCLLNIDNNVIQYVWTRHITISLRDGATDNGMGILGIFMHPLANCVISMLHRLLNIYLNMKCINKRKKQI